MFAIGLAWIVLTPYLTGLAVGNVGLLNRVVSRHVVLALTVGWSALLTLVVAVIAIGEDAGSATPLLSAPFAGLAFWIPGRRSSDDQRDPPPDPPKDVPPSRVLDQPRIRSRGHAGPHVRPRGRSPLTRAH